MKCGVKLYIHSKTWTVATVEVWECISNFAPYFIMDVIIHPFIHHLLHWRIYTNKTLPRIITCTFKEFSTQTHLKYNNNKTWTFVKLLIGYKVVAQPPSRDICSKYNEWDMSQFTKVYNVSHRKCGVVIAEIERKLSNFNSTCRCTTVAYFTKEVNRRLAKRPLKTNGRLANRRLTSLVKEATVVSFDFAASDGELCQ